MKSSDIISAILKTFSQVYNVSYPQLSLFVSNDNGTSYYLSQKRGSEKIPVQIRISNHGTYLKTWVDRQHLNESKERLLDPSHCINISVVFIDEGHDITKDCPNQPNCENCSIEPCIPQTFEGQNELGHPFKVFQYCYRSKFIRNRYINGITKSIAEAISKGEYIDPLRNLYRQAKPKTLQSNIEITKESKIYKNMKQNVKRINESQLRAIIAESVKKVLKEDTVWYGKTEPFEQIIVAASNIMDNFRHTQEPDYESMDDDFNSDIDGEIYKWGDKVKEDTYYWLMSNSSNSSINGGEDW